MKTVSIVRRGFQIIDIHFFLTLFWSEEKLSAEQTIARGSELKYTELSLTPH